MLRIVYTPETIVTIINNDPTMGTTYTPFNVLICSEQEALDFFNAYPQDQVDKLIEFIETGNNPGTIENIEL